MAPQKGPLSLSTFPSGGRTDPPLRGDYAHGAAPLPMMLRAIHAHSAQESARLLGERVGVDERPPANVASSLSLLAGLLLLP